MLDKKITVLAVILTGTVALLITIGLPGPTWLAIALGVAAGVELAALIFTTVKRRA